ncbi:hypothetical protein QQF64_019410 [Cirrhinus molitorella]|uniref:Uncharacterized protein n=1 Tax=Cirrhinus molitorella TaxID=172907 RepID=A0ABR3LFD5_9TELE
MRTADGLTAKGHIISFRPGLAGQTHGARKASVPPVYFAHDKGFYISVLRRTEPTSPRLFCVISWESLQKLQL